MTAEQVLDAIATITRHISASPSLEDLCDKLVAELRTRLQIDRVFVYQMQANGIGAVIAEALQPGLAPLFGLTLPVQIGGLGRGGSSPQLQPMTDALPTPRIEWPAHLQVRAYLLVPILVNGQCWGFLVNHHSQPRIWQPLEVQLLQQVALQLGSYVSGNAAFQQRQEITERALHQAHQHLTFHIDNTPLATIVWDHQVRVQYWSKQAERLFGWRAAEVLGKTLQDFPLVLETDRVQIWQESQNLLKGEGRKVYKNRNYRKDGTVIDCEWYNSTLRDGTGEIVSILSLVQDVSDRQRAETALRQRAERERLLRRITEHIRQSLDLDTILATTVTEVQRILGADRALIFRLHPNHFGEVIQEAVTHPYPSIKWMRWSHTYLSHERSNSYQRRPQIILDVDTEACSACSPELLQMAGVKSKILAPIVHGGRAEGNQVWGLLMVHACATYRQWLPAEGGLLQQIADQLAIAIHQSELYQQVKQLNTDLEKQVQWRTSQLQLTLGFKSILHDIIERVRSSLDEAHILQAAVDALGEGLGAISCNASLYDLDAGTATVCYEYNPPLLPRKGQVYTFASYPALYAPLLQGGGFQFCNLRPDPIRGTKAILVWAIADESQVLGDLWLINDRDHAFRIWEVQLVQQVANQCAIALRQSRLYQAAQAQVDELERLNGLKDDFLSTVSHELRTPMSNIKMATQMLEISLKAAGMLQASPDGVHRYFQILKDECQREISLINDLLDLARLDAGSEPLIRVPVQLQSVIPRLAEPFTKRAENQQHQLTVEVAPDLPPVMLDLHYLERILTELFNNACKYTPPGGHIRVAAQRIFPQASGQEEGDSSFLLVEVSNTGIEIPTQEYSRIFEKFYRIPKGDPWKHGGTGLGLALVKKLVERLEGQIYVTSENGQTTFTVQIPCKY